MSKIVKEFRTFHELAHWFRYQTTKQQSGQKPHRLPTAPVQPVLTSHEKLSKARVKGRVNTRRR